MTDANEVLNLLRAAADPASLPGMARFAIVTEGRLGLSIYDLRRIAKAIPPSHALALDLWESGIQDARLLASMLDVPSEATEAQIERWVLDFNSWDICDQVCDNLFQHIPFAWQKIGEWHTREEEFVKRAAYALIACKAWHDKTASNEQLIALFPVIRDGATDPRNFVKKAVNWALRNIAKRNLALNQAAIAFAEELLLVDDKTARWIARDALKEMRSEKMLARLKKQAK
jgi:3-methyladenine DNA glycosylase AlkD